jgi:hypothetical protein
MKKAISRGTHVSVNLPGTWVPATVIDFEYVAACFSFHGNTGKDKGHYIYTVLTTKGKKVRLHQCLVIRA